MERIPTGRSPDVAAASLKEIDRYLDPDFVVDSLVTLARTPTDVPLGQNEIEPTDPKLKHYVHGVVAPRITELGLGPVQVDELNNLTCPIGSGSSPSLLIMGYMSAQHGNYTDPALEGRLMNARAYGDDEDCVFGKGTAQNKGALAAVLGALQLLARMEIRLPGAVTFVLNAESQSSHRCSVQLFDRNGLRADAGWLAIGTPGIVIGHRGLNESGSRICSPVENQPVQDLPRVDCEWFSEFYRNPPLRW